VKRWLPLLQRFEVMVKTYLGIANYVKNHIINYLDNKLWFFGEQMNLWNSNPDSLHHIMHQRQPWSKPNLWVTWPFPVDVQKQKRLLFVCATHVCDPRFISQLSIHGFFGALDRGLPSIYHSISVSITTTIII